MAWYDEAVFYHIYPLGLCGAPKQNAYGTPEHRLNDLIDWIPHIRKIGCNALYIGPLFESVGHGYETTDYKKLDSRLGTNADLKQFVATCHEQGIRVIFDGVFNHTGRDFFAFKDIQQYRENSWKKDWYCNVNFWGNNEYNDGFSYENWGGYNLLVKLNQKNPEVQEYICDVIRFWVEEFDVDGIRLDAADVLDFGFMRVLRQVANSVKPDFWLMGEVIHGDYARWANADTLHSVTNYHLHKALYSGHNDHNYFEIAHTVRRLNDLGGRQGNGLKLYNFVDNHDVERIYTKLNNKAHYLPTHVLLYTLPGIPSIYYGSEFGIEGRKERGSDDSLRPALKITDYADAVEKNWCTGLISRLGIARVQLKALAYGSYTEHVLTTGQYAFSRNYEGQNVLVTVNNADHSYEMHLPANGIEEYVGVISGQKIQADHGTVHVNVPGNSGEVWVPVGSVVLDQMPDTVITRTETETLKQPTETAPETETPKQPTETAPEIEIPKQPTETAPEIEIPKQPTETAPEIEAPEQPEEVKPETEKPEKPAEIKAEKTVETEVPKTEASITKKAAEPVPAVVPKMPTQQENKSGRTLDHVVVPENKSWDEMSIEELQTIIYNKMKKNGPVTDRMYQDIIENVYPDSLKNWIRSFR